MEEVNTIEIWSPKFSTDEVLIAVKRVKKHNRIIFTKTKHLAGRVYYISGQVAREYPIQSNGSISCYCIPMNKLELISKPITKQEALTGVSEDKQVRLV